MLGLGGSLEHPDNRHVRELHVRLDHFAHRVARLLQLVNSRFVDQLLDVRFLPIQLLQGVNRIVVRLFGAIDGARFLILVEQSQGGRNCQRVPVIVDITFLLIKVGKTGWLLLLSPRYFW